MNLNKFEIENVSSLEPFKRYKYLLKMMADSEKYIRASLKSGR